uniref:Selenoprotein S n=1 Tax=Dendroctonus ponderosae TaxID=77166 RepID=A0AAR5QHH7_DENPD
MDYLREAYAYLTQTIGYTLAVMQTYFWHILIGAIAFYYLFTKFLGPALGKLYGSYEQYRKRKEISEYEAKYHKNPDLFAARLSAQQAAAQKLQEKYDKDAREYREKLIEKEARKRQEVENLLNQSDKGHRLGNSNDKGKDESKPFRPEYHPLMGPGSSSNYRPPKKSKCGGGGCGK